MTQPPQVTEGDGCEQPQDLEKAVSHLLEEGRMVLPGIQALFGFQMIAVFNNAFGALDPADKAVHLTATGLVALGIALVLAPVAFHRQVEPHGLSETLVRYSTVVLMAAQALVMVALCLDFSVVAQLAIRDARVSWSLSGALLAFFITMWFIIPNLVRRRRRQARARAAPLQRLL